MIPQPDLSANRADITILIIDDDPEALEATELTVRSAGYSTVVGGTAAEAIALAAQHRPTLVLLDVCLPDGDGVDVARQLKRDPALDGLFIILLSGERTSAEDQAQGLQEGLADGYVTRPIARREFLARIEAFLRIHDVQSRLRAAMRELERSNKDLEQFAYVASHDLQAPLRMVSMYTQLLAKRYEGRLDDDADDFIGFIVDGAARMSRLLEDLLAYSRVGSEAPIPQPVNAMSAAGQAVTNLEATIAESGAVVVIDDLPVVLADDGMLVRVFQNLIANAVKFHAPDTVPRVSVSAARTGAMWQFSVADRGIGIPPEYFDGVFDVFRRLHPQGEYPGSGVGLAVCKRIIELFGGTIWIEQSDDSGTTFCFTLPAA